MFNRSGAISISLFLWHISYWIAMLFSWSVLEMIIAWVRDCFGIDSQTNSHGFHLVVSWTWIFVSICIPTLVSVVVLDRCLGSRPQIGVRAGVMLILIFVGVAATVGMLYSDLASVYREWDHRLFGFPESPYSNRNLVPRLLAVTTASLPAVAFVLWLYTRVPRTENGY